MDNQIIQAFFEWFFCENTTLYDFKKVETDFTHKSISSLFEVREIVAIWSEKSE